MLPRSYLYVPADNERFLVKAESSAADFVILDLEDSVANQNKSLARAAAKKFLDDTKRSGIAIRVNPENIDDEKDLINHPKVERIFLPKVSKKAEVHNFIEKSKTTKKLTAIIESALGFTNIKEIAEVPQVATISLGEIDLFTSLVVADKANEDIKLFARATLVYTSSSFDKYPPICPVNSNFNDIENFEAETMKFRSMGYWGRACIHPDQIEVANRVFSVDKELLRKAEEIVALLGDGKNGVAKTSDGQMVDIANLNWAKKYLTIAQ